MVVDLKACVEINVAKGAWRDVSCGEYRPFICKRKMGECKCVLFFLVPTVNDRLSAATRISAALE